MLLWDVYKRIWREMMKIMQGIDMWEMIMGIFRVIMGIFRVIMGIFEMLLEILGMIMTRNLREM